MKRLVLLLIALLGLPSIAQATTYYLDDAGSDAAAGTSTSVPWKTWAKAFSASTACGDTLIVMDGTYTTAVHGNPDLNARVCTAGNVFTIQAQTQRAAKIQGSGNDQSFQIRNSAYIVVDGLYITGADNTSTSGDSTIRVTASSHVTFKNGIVTHNNRYWNTHLLQYTDSTDSLIEGNEFYSFHRHAVILNRTNTTVVRQNYCHSRSHADIPGGYVSGNTSAGDDCYIAYPGSNNIFENNIAEGVKLKGFAVEAISPGATGNKFYGNIDIGGQIGLALDARGVSAGLMPQNTTIVDFVSIGSTIAGIRFNGSKTSTCTNCTATGGTATGFNAGFQEIGDGIYSFTATDLLTFNNTGTGVLLNLTGLTWTITDSNSNSNGTNYNPSSNASYDPSDTPSAAAPGMANCYLWAPDSSTAQTNDWGATILYRYENGVLGTTPLWDPTTGEFPHGEIVTGVNDIDGSSAYNVHERLHVGTANGCAFPASFSGSTPPQNPATYTNYEGTAGGTLGTVTIPASMDFVGVCVGLIDSAFNVGSVSSVTIGGEALTLLAPQPSFTNFRRAALAYKLAPTSGASRSVVVNTTGAVTGIQAVVMQHDDISAVNTAATGSGNGTAISTTGLTNTGELVTDCLATGKTYNISAGAGQTVQRSDDHTTQLLRLTTSTQSGNDGGVMSYTNQGTTNWSQIVLSLLPTTPDPPVTPCTLTQSNGRVDSAFLVDGAVSALGAINAANVNIPVGTSFAVALQTDSTVAACATQGRKLYVSHDSGAYVPVTDTLTAGLVFHGATGDPLLVNGAVSACLDAGALTQVAGTTIQSAATNIFTVAMTQDDCTTNRWVLTFGPEASGTYEFREYTDAGVALDAYGATADAKVTVTGTSPDISAPTNLKIATSTNTLISLIWTPVSYTTLAGYKVYQSTTSGVYDTVPLATITPTTAAAVNTPVTSYSTQTPVAATYYWVVKAFDHDGNLSAVSNEVSSVQSGFTARSASTGSAATARSASIGRDDRCTVGCY